MFCREFFRKNLLFHAANGGTSLIGALVLQGGLTTCDVQQKWEMPLTHVYLGLLTVRLWASEVLVLAMLLVILLVLDIRLVLDILSLTRLADTSSRYSVLRTT